jgi:hypothetical protein
VSYIISSDPEFSQLLAPRSLQAAREVRRDSALRRARTCYHHLAGIAGVSLLDEMLSRGWFNTEQGEKTLYRLTSPGERSLLKLGVDVPGAASQRRPFAYGCLDWTERRYHLRGSLADAILTAMAYSGAVNRTTGTRAVSLKGPVSDWFDL